MSIGPPYQIICDSKDALTLQLQRQYSGLFERPPLTVLRARGETVDEGKSLLLLVMTRRAMTVVYMLPGAAAERAGYSMLAEVATFWVNWGELYYESSIDL